MKNNQIQNSFMQDNKNIVSKHSWSLVIPLNKRGLILWNHLKENEKYIKYFDFDDVNAEYYNLLDIGGETYKMEYLFQIMKNMPFIPKIFKL